MTLLTADMISHSFDYELFSDISLHVKQGEKIAITGESGSGKSSLLHILSSLLKPVSGRVKILHKDIALLKRGELDNLRCRDIGIIFQSHYLFKGFSALENIEVATILSGQNIDDELLKKLKIFNIINKKISDISGGQQQRVSIARVLSKKPKIIFADEPTGNLDANTAKEIMDIFDDYVTNQEAALVVVTHDMSIANSCHKIFHLEDKKLNRVR